MSTYHAELSLGERYWLIHVREIDQWTQARNLDEAEHMARDLIATWNDVPIESVTVEVALTLPAAVRDHLDRVTKCREAAAAATSEAARQYRAAAHGLKAHGLTVRDIGKALHISHQRVQQLLTGA